MAHKHYLCILLSLLFVNISQAEDIFAITDDGKKVRLKDDQTWSYHELTVNPAETSVEPAEEASPEANAELAEEEPVETKVDLKLIRKWDYKHTCKLGLTLTNRKAKYIKNIAPKLTAHLKGGVKYETVIVGFYGIKPTKYQYREAMFKGIDCDDIDYVLVHGGDHCSVGREYTLFAIVEGECLAAINVEKSDLLDIHK